MPAPPRPRRTTPPEAPTREATPATTEPLSAAGELLVAIDRQLQAIASEAMSAWHASKDASPGDPRYLDAALTALDLRGRLLGLYAPVRYEITGPDGSPLRVICLPPVPDAILTPPPTRDHP